MIIEKGRGDSKKPAFGGKREIGGTYEDSSSSGSSPVAQSSSIESSPAKPSPLQPTAPEVEYLVEPSADETSMPLKSAMKKAVPQFDISEVSVSVPQLDESYGIASGEEEVVVIDEDLYSSYMTDEEEGGSLDYELHRDESQESRKVSGSESIEE